MERRVWKKSQKEERLGSITLKGKTEKEKLKFELCLTVLGHIYPSLPCNICFCMQHHHMSMLAII